MWYFHITHSPDEGIFCSLLSCAGKECAIYNIGKHINFNVSYRLYNISKSKARQSLLYYIDGRKRQRGVNRIQ